MRLQLTVQRHGLPPVQVLWTLTSAVRPPLLAAGNSITISQFLEQVNEILPLESEDWGLEDYSVEVRGFECLHFAELNQVLKEDDEVCIRPLQTQDLRFRKISGRHQIAADGKHLVDGVAFGRPFLRRADRPAIRIPPRKKRRITYDEGNDIDTEEPNHGRQVILRAGFVDTDDAAAGDESDEEDDFASEDEEEDNLAAELRDLQDDLSDSADADESVRQDGVQPQRATGSRGSPNGLGLLQLLDENGRPFPKQYNNPLLDLYGQDEPTSSLAEIRVRKRGAADLIQSSSENTRSILRDSSASCQRVGRRDSAGSSRGVRFDNLEPATSATIGEMRDPQDAEDGDFGPDRVDESDKENAEPQDEDVESSTNFFEGSQSSSTTSSDDLLSDDKTSSSGSSSSDSSSNPDSEQQRGKDIDHDSETSETSSSGSSSSSSSESEPEEPKTGQKRKWAVHNVKLRSLADEVPSVVTIVPPTMTPPGDGSSWTRSRNKRRKESKKLAFIKSKGILPATATKSDLRKFEERTSQPDRQEIIAAGGVRAAFEAKRQDLLNSLATGGIDINHDSKLQENAGGTDDDQLLANDRLSKAAATQDISMTEQPASEEYSGKNVSESPSANDRISTPKSVEVQVSTTDLPVEATAALLTDSLSATTTALVPDSFTATHVEAVESLAKANDSRSTSGAMEVSKSKKTPVSESQHRRSKLDISGAKRMLFGSLGLRTPKTKADELKTREKLMKDVRSVKEPQVDEDIETVEDIRAAAEDKSWKDKIDLRAVECCYEGIELSTPPFPFVQRWDPQQQQGYNMGNARRRKGKKRKRNNDRFYEDSSYRPQDTPEHCDDQNYCQDNSHSLQNTAMRPEEDDWARQETEQESPIDKANAESKNLDRSHNEHSKDAVKIKEQLLHETEDASAHTLVELDETIDLTSDLPTLPKDLSMFLSLTRDTAAKGNLVAFKQLEMSAETNWQPKISEYRTAIIDEVLDDGTLAMTLAKRDEPSKNIQFDEQTGERLYSKFEMPGYHDENGKGNDRKIDISFDELINPVLVKAAYKKGNRDYTLQAQDHVVVHCDSDNGIVIEEVHDIDAGPQSVSLGGQSQDAPNEKAAVSSEEARQEISELIRDAGWRSSIRSEVNHELIDRRDGGPSSQSAAFNEPALVGPPSPKFHGFSTNTIINGCQVASSPPPAALQIPGQVHASHFEIAESVPPQGPDDSPARSITSNSRSIIGYPNLREIDDDSDLFQQEAQDRSGLLEAEHQIASQDPPLPSSVRHSSSQSIASPTLTSPEKSSPKIVDGFDGADSDDSFPELFSQAFENRMSQSREFKSQLSEEDSISPPSHRRSKRKTRAIPSQRKSNRDWEHDHSEGEDENDGVSTPRLSQPGFSSQIVDLTISSDTVNPPDDSYIDDDSDVLPIGPGWVHKARMSEPHKVSTKKTTTRGSMRNLG